MAYKHIKEYYDKICEQYLEMKDEIRDFEIEAQNNIMEPERLDMIKEQIKPLMDNYERWSYMMYLLNLPVKKSKQKSYQERNKKFINKLNKNNSLQSILEENKQVINKMRGE